MRKSEECGRDYTVPVPPPPIDGHLYPIIEHHPNEVARGPPPYNEQQQIGCQPIGVRYFVHGQQDGGRSSGNNSGREFHAIHTTLPANGDTVFYYISSSSSPSDPNCKRNEPFLLIRRRRSSIASIVLASLLASILLIVFVRMHTEFARKHIQQQEVFK
ncbi:unnamed protein product [Meloidogyne enterolobii]|uniref:Uncharacterized protein n=1 Tax=Meloidogyne enterolobii TaxID=390850 RepID=A0ACB0ZIU5_MELEN